VALRVAVFTNILTPYRVQLFNAVSEPADVELKVFLCGRTEPGREWTEFDSAGFSHEVVPGVSWRKRNRQTGHFSWRAVSYITRWHPDVVVGGGTTIIALLAFVASRRARRPFVWWLDVTEAADSALSTPLLSNLKRLLARRADSVLASSSLARDYARSLGTSEDRVFISLLTVDTLALGELVDKERLRACDLRAELGIRGHVIGYFGHIEKHKGIAHIVEAAKRLKHRVPAPTLLFVGAGSRLLEAKEQCAAADIDAVFVGFQQPEALPKYYAICDVFWLLSDIDCFGVVAVEAAAAGLPLLVSEFAGASGDAVRNGSNGWVVDPSDASRIAGLVDALFEDDRQRAAFADESRRLALTIGIDVARDGFLRAVSAAVRTGGAAEWARVAPPRDGDPEGHGRGAQ
jgi:glycosyltransferase involved in cell wall biosynthesis